MPGGYEEVRSDLLTSGGKYEDPDFPAAKSSLRIEEAEGENWDSIEWKRPHEICDDPKFITDGASRYDLSQGDLGNCWFLSATAVLATKPDLFTQVVPHDQSFDEDYVGLFRFRFWRYGNWQEVLVDDRLPTRNGKLIYCHNRDSTNEFWSALIEKAYAKAHGCYQVLESGFGHEALVDFTGGIGEFIDISHHNDKRPKLFRTTKRMFKMNSLMCASISVRDDGAFEDKLDNGLVTGHAYSVTNIQQVEVDGDQKQLIRLRNPWGFKEWNGAWSDGSDEWAAISDEMRAEFDLRVQDDGEFWMPFADFCDNFNSLEICHLSPDSVKGGSGKSEWNMTSFHGEWVAGVTAGGCGVPPNQAQYWSNPQYFVRLADPDDDDEDEKCTLCVSITQKFRRQLKVTQATTEELDEAIGFDILRFKGDVPDELDGQNFDQRVLEYVHKMQDYEYLRERSKRFELSPGVYGVIPCTYSPDTELEFLLRLASEKPAETGAVDHTGPVEPSEGGEKVRLFDRLFQRYAGEDTVVDHKELKQILNDGLKKDKDEPFGKSTCRSLIAWGGNGERSGTVNKGECKNIWKQVKSLQETFDEYDADASGSLSRKELKKAFKAMGFSISKQTLGRIALQYCGKQGGLDVDDFVLLVTKASKLFERHQQIVERDGVAAISLDEWLETTLLT